MVNTGIMKPGQGALSGSSMKILFYIEPVHMRSNALFLETHASAVRCIINANPDATYALASGVTLLNRYGAYVAEHGGAARHRLVRNLPGTGSGAVRL